jgi:hypothetical protein
MHSAFWSAGLAYVGRPVIALRNHRDRIGTSSRWSYKSGLALRRPAHQNGPVVDPSQPFPAIALPFVELRVCFAAAVCSGPSANVASVSAGSDDGRIALVNEAGTTSPRLHYVLARQGGCATRHSYVHMADAAFIAASGARQTAPARRLRGC